MRVFIKHTHSLHACLLAELIKNDWFGWKVQAATVLIARSGNQEK